MIKRRVFIKNAGTSMISTAILPKLIQAKPKKRPNFVVFMADDFGYECLSCNGGSPYKTPVLDNMARNGIRFSNFVAQPLCTPSRVKIMTGRYNFRNYIKFGTLELPEKTFGHVLEDAGYTTCIVGKWQLGRKSDLPKYFGFDEHCLWQLTTKKSRYQDPGIETNAGEMVTHTGKYGPDIVSDYTLDFISRHKDKPFFIYYPMILTHSPYPVTPDSKDPECKDKHSNFKDMVEYTDKIVGKIKDHLKKNGVLDNTVMLFTGDNGTGKGITSKLNGKEYPGQKGSMNSESGPHVPFIAYYPDGGVKGQVMDDPIDFSDFLPTLADMAGAKIPDDRPIDGTSFAGRLLNDKKHKPRGWAYVCYYGKKRIKPSEFVRDNKYKLMDTGELIDFVNDPFHNNPIDVNKAGADIKARRDKLQKILNKMALEREKEDQRLIKEGLLARDFKQQKLDKKQKKGRNKKGKGKNKNNK